MSRTARTESRPRHRLEAEALFHIHAGGARILNLRHIPGDTSATALRELGMIRVDRRTPWGNPFVVGRDGSRARVVELYRRDLWRRIRSGEMPLERLASIAHMPLCCWCWPKRPCHAEVLARAAAWAAGQLERGCAAP